MADRTSDAAPPRARWRRASQVTSSPELATRSRRAGDGGERYALVTGLDEYQELAQETAIFPRVYTEVQVANMIRRLVSREINGEIDWLDAPQARFDRRSTIEAYLDEFETPFTRLVYPLLGLAGETGEILNKAKKIARDNQGEMDFQALESAEGELADAVRPRT